MTPTRLPPLSNQQLRDLYRRCVELGQVLDLKASEWSPTPTSELIAQIRKEPKP